MQKLRDIHLHIIYGVDDGAQKREDMFAMLDQAHENNVTTLYCTSHQTCGMDEFDRTTYFAHMKEAREYIREKGYEILLFAGAEILYTPAMANFLANNKPPVMGNTSYVLMEFVPDVSFDEIERSIKLLESYHYIPIIAHIERYETMFHNKVERLKQQHNVRFQINCNAVLKKHGFMKDRTINKWLQQQLIDYISSDSHDTTIRPNQMMSAFEIVSNKYGEEYAARIMGDAGNGSL